MILLTLTLKLVNKEKKPLLENKSSLADVLLCKYELFPPTLRQ